jgi:hypothetical protein
VWISKPINLGLVLALIRPKEDLYMCIRSVVIFPRQTGFIWLCRKKNHGQTGVFGGWEGEFDKELGDKTLREAAIRVLSASARGVPIYMSQLQKVAVIKFSREGEEVRERHVYFCSNDSWNDKIASSEDASEGEHFNLWGIPLERMSKLDQRILPIVIKEERIQVQCSLSPTGEIENFEYKPLD